METKRYKQQWRLPYPTVLGLAVKPILLERLEEAEEVPTYFQMRVRNDQWGHSLARHAWLFFYWMSRGRLTIWPLIKSAVGLCLNTAITVTIFGFELVFRQTTFERRSKVFMHHACSLNKNVNCQKYAVDECPYDTFWMFAVAMLDVKTMVIFTNILIMYELDSEAW